MTRYKTIIKLLITLLTASAVIAVILYLLSFLIAEPPVYEVNNARIALSKAGQDRAESYSSLLYSEAHADFDSAMAYWKEENERFIFLRNYEQVKMLANQAAGKAEIAGRNSLSNTDYLKVKLKVELDSLKKTVEYLDTIFGRYPFSPEVRLRISNGKMLLKEGFQSYRDSDYLTANTRISDAGFLLNTVFENTVSELRDYFKSYPEWISTAQSAIIDSRKTGSYSVIIDKMSKKCVLYLGGEKKYEFDAELGRNWIGTKRIMGDKATPEGLYKITRKYQGRDTQYHKSLALDYPNINDQIRFRNDQANGSIPPSARIGGGIEIHGGGGKGVDWTDGCIALANSDIDIVFNLIKIGTPVIIVGSTKSIEEILLR